MIVGWRKRTVQMYDVINTYTFIKNIYCDVILYYLNVLNLCHVFQFWSIVVLQLKKQKYNWQKSVWHIFEQDAFFVMRECLCASGTISKSNDSCSVMSSRCFCSNSRYRTCWATSSTSPITADTFTGFNIRETAIEEKWLSRGSIVKLHRL